MLSEKLSSPSVAEPGPVGGFMMSAALAGFRRLGFPMLIGLFHNVLFLGQFVFAYDANVFTPASPWASAWSWCPLPVRW